MTKICSNTREDTRRLVLVSTEVVGSQGDENELPQALVRRVLCRGPGGGLMTEEEHIR